MSPSVILVIVDSNAQRKSGAVSQSDIVLVPGGQLPGDDHRIGIVLKTTRSRQVVVVIAAFIEDVHVFGFYLVTYKTRLQQIDELPFGQEAVQGTLVFDIPVLVAGVITIEGNLRTAVFRHVVLVVMAGDVAAIIFETPNVVTDL